MGILILFTVSVLFFGGCSGKKNQLFSKNVPLDNRDGQLLQHEHYKIKPHDRLSIIFFDYPELSTISKDRPKNDIGIEVNSKGVILMPLIGEVVVANKSKEEVSKLLYQRYLSYLEKPVLRVEILNQKIYVLGEVKNPGTLELINHRALTPLKAVIESGGLTDFAQRDVIKVVRGTKESYYVFHIDFTDMSSIENANIALFPDDIVYVAHNRVKDFNLPLSGANPSLSWISTLFSTLTLYQALK